MGEGDRSWKAERQHGGGRAAHAGPWKSLCVGRSDKMDWRPQGGQGRFVASGFVPNAAEKCVYASLSLSLSLDAESGFGVWGLGLKVSGSGLSGKISNNVRCSWVLHGAGGVLAGWHLVRAKGSGFQFRVQGVGFDWGFDVFCV